jgi:sulfate adenylyltransferase subunit 1
MATLAQTRSVALSHFTAHGAEKPVLRISTAGSVDDGKSTLIGRLLYDTKTVWEDHLEEVNRSKVNRASHGADLSLLTDGLRAEREQGITIDVAYRYFSTPRRTFIVADTPGHEQYTRNMATGASTCDVAIILLDARKGVLEQSRRHATIAWLLGIRRLIFAVNKMDLVDFSYEAFDRIRNDAVLLLENLEGAIADFIPLSALDGDNVVTRSARAPWYDGPALLELLETLDPPAPMASHPFRMAVQTVIRPHLDFRGYAGQIGSGWVRVGDEVAVLPRGATSRVKRIVTFDGDLEEAFAPMSVTLELEDDLDIARGDLLAASSAQPQIARRVHSTLVWMNETPLDANKTYLLRHCTNVVPARVSAGSRAVELNEIARVEVETAAPIAFDSYRQNRATGGFILIDPVSNLTFAAGLIEGEIRADEEELESFSDAPFTPAERRKLRMLLAHMKRFGLSFDSSGFKEGEGI